MPASFQITELYRQIGDPGLVNGLLAQAIAHLQDNAYFRLAYEKQRRREHLHRTFAGRSELKILISNNLRHLGLRSPRAQVSYLDDRFLREILPGTFEQKCAALAGAIVVVNNNDAHANGSADAYIRLYNECSDTLFIAWDWDNHHWLSLSPVLAAHSDLYVPTHPDNHYALSRFNAAITEPVAAGVAQWTWAFLEQHAHELAGVVRTNDPLGKHIPYGPFQYRNQVLTTLSPQFASIGFSSHQFHQLTPEQKFAEWCGHKCHWIVPVLNDIPIRVFDAFVTGGIPLLPESLRFTRWLADAHADDVLYYAAGDIVAPQALVARTCQLFDAAGVAGIERRYRYGMDKHHGDNRIREMLGYAARLFEFVSP